MLILTRRIDEVICIGDTVRVTVLGVKGSQVRIGVEAPKDITVDREEVYDRKRLDGSPPPQGIGAGTAPAPRNHPLDPLPST